ncbi:copper oxidase [Pseudoxanthomonas yeongjuensis]|uniref:copper resistance system multicopper oxidase n=1 Tax=Pseudoxanthomonas yeongjuensis TaxID=377616 RepID=UPI0013914F7E|nr:copper resistance system multicopper oxidase [Pseudoxanthomonas yeongjuensis]KAF1717906.1 copper oxidase [Pseudoxanthomonas yeongjuensis]
MVVAGAHLPFSATAADYTTSSPTPELRGTDFELSVAALPVNLTGRSATAIAINGTLPGPVLRWREGDTVTLRVANRLGVDTSIHWHGILLPSNMDGVPGFSFHGIAPGETFTYRFQLKQAGTYWYHAHSSLQEAKGVYGAIVIEPRDADPIAADRDYVVLLSDWSDEDPHAIVRKLKIQADYYNRHKQTVGDLFSDARRDGWKATIADRKAWGAMRMSPTDLADVNAVTYTYLVNGTTPDGNWTGLFKRGEKVRLRFINGSAMTFFDIRIPGLKLTVVGADGQPVHPVSVDEFRIGVAETFDVIVTPEEEQPYTIFAQAMDRSGYARGTLSPRAGLQAPVPALDARALLTMTDMGHGGMAGMKGMEGSCGAGMKMGEGGCGANMQVGMDHSKMDHGAMKHDAMAGMVSHPASESGNPAVDMQTMTPSKALDDPGIGLRGNGRRVLTYADLKSTFADPDPREPGRTLELHLTGNMERYVWGFDGIPFSKAEPIRLNHGERMRIVLVNDTMMEHPVHLHGLWSDLESEAGEFQVRKHTINVPPGHVRSYRVSADALGRWAYHCHMLLHMELGMFREVRVE